MAPTCDFASLLVVLLRHVVQYQASASVHDAIGQIPAVFGLPAKLLWRLGDHRIDVGGDDFHGALLHAGGSAKSLSRRSPNRCSAMHLSNID